MKLAQATLAFAILISAVPASAAQAPAGPKAGAPAAEKKYCLEYEDLTGSRVRKQECKTKAQWAREGVNVSELAGTRR